MRRGDDAQLLLDKKGRVFGIATGSDCCAEHETGSKKMQGLLCQGADKNKILEHEIVKKLRLSLKEEKSLIERIFPSKPFEYPQLIEEKAIGHNLEKLTFKKGIVDSKSVAVFGFVPESSTLDVDHRELRFRDEKQEVAGAWDNESFAIAVRGDKLIEKFEEFAKSVIDGDGMFGGTFLRHYRGKHLSGVVIVRRSMLRPEHMSAIKEAQAKFEADLRLKAKSSLEKLHEICKNSRQENKHARLPGYLWPLWRDNRVDGDVVYGLNPDYNVKAPYYGPYDFDQLARWITSEIKFELVPVKQYSIHN